MTAESGALVGRVNDPSNAYEIREISANSLPDLDKVAAMHMELLGFGPMAGLGNEFVREICYAALMREQVLDTAIAEFDREAAGFVAYTRVSLEFHRSGLSKHWMRAGWYVMRSLLRDPRRLPRLVRAIRVLLSRRAELAPLAEPLGEIVCVAVRPRFLAAQFVRKYGLRISEDLIRHAASELRSAGVRRMRMLVDADNRPVLMLYHRLGARFEPYEQAGKPQVQVWFDLGTGALA
jgi:ribosomal protein S18 acetylase RimI-like enzyme